MAPRSSRWWLHVWCLVILQHTWICSNQPAPTNETHWDNFTTGLDQVYVTIAETTETLIATNNETSRSPNIILETSWSNSTTRPDDVFITSKETPDTTPVEHATHISQDTSGTPNSTLVSPLNNTPTGPDLSYISKETTRTPNTTLQSHPENVTSGSHLTYITDETSGIHNSTLEKFPNNATTGPDLSYITEETSRAPNNTLQNYPSNVTSVPNLTYITQYTSGTSTSPLETNPNNATTGPYLSYVTEETSRAPNNTLENYPSNVTSGPNLTYITQYTSGTSTSPLETNPNNSTTGPYLSYITEETSSAFNGTLENYPSNVTSGPHLTYITQYTSGTSTSPLETYPNNATTGPDLSYITEETSRSPSTTTEKYPSNVPSESHLTNITEETSRSPSTTTEKYPSNVTSGSHRTEITEETSRTLNTSLMSSPSNVTTAGDLTYITEETSRTPDNTLEPFSNVTSRSDVTYPIGETVRSPNSTLEQVQSNVTTDPGLVYPSEKTTGTPNTSLEVDRTSYPDINNQLNPIDTNTESPSTWTPNTSLQTGGTSFISAVRCFQDSDCPPFTMCTQQGALHTCQCHLGYFFHQDLGCVVARTFPARIPISILYWHEILVNTSVRGNIGDEIGHMEAAPYYQGIHNVRILFQDVLGHIPGYVSTSVTDVQLDKGHVTIVHLFSTLYGVTEEDIWRALTVSPLFCDDPHDGCVSPLTSDNYQGLSLCDFDVCDSSSSDCHFHGGLVTCECRRGYYQFSPTDRSCRECGSGYRRTESGCERCPIGFGGFNCDESYLLAVIVESCVGCGLLVSLITLLVFYFRRKKPQKPMFIDSIVLGVPTNQPSIRLPRAQFSWRREWEWNEPPEKVLTDIQQETTSPDGPAIHMKTFGDPERFSAPSSFHGRHNLSFISD